MAKKHVVIAAVAGGVALTIAGGVAVAVALHKNDVVLSVDGETHSVSVREDTVKQVLEKDGITVGEHDVVAPSLDTKITNGMEISVLYGRQLQLTIDGEARTVWTTSRTVDDALTQLNLNDPDSKLSTSRSAAIGRAGHSDWDGPRILLGQEPICIITCREHRNLPLRELPQIIRKADTGMERDTALWRKENKIPTAKNQIFANNTTTCIEMVRQGLGWGIVPKICLAHFDGCIRPMHFADGRPLVRSTYLLYTEQTAALPQIDAFINLLHESTSLPHTA